MKHLEDLATPINKFANSMQLVGAFLLTIAAVGLVADSANTEDGWDFFKSAMLHLAFAGLILGFIGNFLWKILLKNSDVTKRQFYFRDEE